MSSTKNLIVLYKPIMIQCAGGVEDRLKGYCRQCFESLSIPATDRQICGWTSLIYQSMNTPGRLYHNAEHVLEVLENLEREVGENETTDPISQLAVLFHDVIYYSLDRKFSEQQSGLLKGVVEEVQVEGEEEASLVLVNIADPVFAMVCTVFDITLENDKTPLKDPGRNEFLSALIAVQALKEVLSRSQLLQLTMAIEATMPFRGPSAMPQLYDRGVRALASFCSDTDATVDRAVRRAVTVANADLGVFRTHRPPAFVDSNWRLLPEWYPNLAAAVGVPTLGDWQFALSNLWKRRMDPSRIFVSYKDAVPDLSSRRAAAEANLEFLHRYLSVRLLAIAVVMQVAGLLGVVGEEIPLVQMASIEGSAAARVEAQTSPTVEPSDHDSVVLYQLLKEGRTTDYSWDVKEAPLAAAILRGQQYSQKLVQTILLQHTQQHGKDWLRSIGDDILLGVMEALAVSLAESVQMDLKDGLTKELWGYKE